MGEKGLSQYLKLFSRGTESSAISNELSAQLVNTIEALIVVVDKDGKIMEFNPACERLSGYQKSEAVGRRFDFLIPPEELKGVKQAMDSFFSQKGVLQYQNHWLTRDGQRRLINWSNTHLYNPDGSVKFIIATGVDVTEASLREKRRILMMEIFAALAGIDKQDEVLDRILELIREYAGCDAAAIRLREGADYPYLKTIGFTDEFVRKETLLCSAQTGGTTAQDSGAVELDCMCGRVIRGDLDTSLASKTAEGAFFSGNINELVSSLAKVKKSFTLRNHCGTSGFRSIALIPLRFQQETVGLLQLNDRQAGKFSKDDVDFLTVAGQSIGAALVRFEAEKARETNEKILDALVENARDGVFISAKERQVILYNNAMEKISGYTKEEVMEHGWFYLAFPNEEERRQAVHKGRLVIAGKLDYAEMAITCKDGSKKTVIFSLSPLEIDGKEHILTTMIDSSRFHTR